MDIDKQLNVLDSVIVDKKIRANGYDMGTMMYRELKDEIDTLHYIREQIRKNRP